MSQLNDFDARTVQPKQGFNSHPFGTFDFQITNTYLKDIQSKLGAMLVVELTSPSGAIEKSYNVVNPSADAVRISQEQLSALCHVTGIFQVAFPKKQDGTPNYEMAGHTLRGGRGKMEVIPQKRKNDKGELVETGYAEVNKVFDVNGNEPGKGNAAPQTQGGGQQWGGQPQQQGNPQPNAGSGGQPMQQQPGGGWNNNSAPNNPPPQNQNTGWGQPQNNAPQGQPGQAGPAPWQK